jgi:hypothetical protein
MWIFPPLIAQTIQKQHASQSMTTGTDFLAYIEILKLQHNSPAAAKELPHYMCL